MTTIKKVFNLNFDGLETNDAFSNVLLARRISKLSAIRDEI